VGQDPNTDRNLAVPSTISTPAFGGHHLAPRPRGNKWNAEVAIHLADGVVRHPRLYDVVEEVVGRIMAINIDHAGISVAFGLEGETEEEASADCSEVTGRILGRLGLTAANLGEYLVYERDPRVFDGPVPPPGDVVDLQNARLRGMPPQGLQVHSP